MRPRELTGRRRLLAALLLALLGLVLMPSAAAAHADLDSTVPEDGATVTEPLLHVEILLTNTVEPVASGISVLSGDGSTIPFTTSQPEPSRIVLVFDDPVESGTVVVLWEARSEDGHRIEGTFRVEVVGPGAPATTTTSTIPPDTTTSTAGNAASPSTTTTTVAVAASADTNVDGAAGVTPVDTSGDLLEGVGRWLVIVGVVLAVGAASFAAGALVGSRSEVDRAIRWMNVGGLLVIIGTLVGIVGNGTASGSSIVRAFSPSLVMESFTTAHLAAIALRLVGAIAVMQGPGLVSTAAATSHPSRAAADLGGGPSGDVAVLPRPEERLRLDLANEWLVIAGLVALALSFGLDGHSYAAGTIGRVAAVAHVAAAGVWAGGLVVMADTLIRRRRSELGLEVGAMAVRFSRVASVAIAIVGLAGVALSLSIVQSPSDITSTSWGRLLIAKTALVLVVVAIGAFNHFKVVPRVRSGAAGAAATLRRTIAYEVSLILVVTVITAALVGAAI